MHIVVEVKMDTKKAAKALAAVIGMFIMIVKS
jgi:hypothetical protein